MRLPGDAVFIIGGTLPILYLCFVGVFRMKVQKPREEPNEVLFTEIQEAKNLANDLWYSHRSRSGFPLTRCCSWGVSLILEWLARHSHRRSEHYRNSGFVYKKKEDVWQCPTGHHLTREQTDFERKIAHYRAPAHKCNVCHCKKDCTDSEDGRLLESRMDSWLESELRRFHRGISLALLLLASLILAVEMFRYHTGWEWVLSGMLLLPIGLTGSRHFVSFSEPSKKTGLQ